jgi:hypothetical protein
MTLVYCTMLWKWMRKSSHILRKVQTSVLYLKFLCYFHMCRQVLCCGRGLS